MANFSLAPTSKRRGEKVVRGFLFAAAGLSVVVTVGILASLLIPAVAFLREVPIIEFLTGTRWAPRFEPASFGVLPLVVGTLWTTVIALSVAVPIGLGIAIFLSEYASRKNRRFIKPVIELLAGIPTVVYGFFALEFFTQTILKNWLSLEVGSFSVLSAGFVMGIMIVPTIASISEDALNAVPQALRQGSFALGANKMQTTIKVVIPAALSGIAAAIVLGVSRAVGETMIVSLAAGNRPNISLNPLEGAQTMTGFIANAALGDSRVGSVEYNTLFAVGALLFLLTLLINMISIRLVRKFRQVY
jgi:phosphate transport system permease protein